MNTQTDDQPRRFLLGSRWRRETRRVFCVFNHKNGNLCTQWFSDVEELESSHSTRWKPAENAESKIETFSKQDWVFNLRVIPEARDANEAVKIAMEKFGMAPLQRTVVITQKTEG